MYRKRAHTRAKKRLTVYLFFLSLKDLLLPAHSCLKSYYDKNRGMDFLPPLLFCKRQRKHIRKCAKSLPAKFHPTVNFYCWLL